MAVAAPVGRTRPDTARTSGRSPLADLSRTAVVAPGAAGGRTDRVDHTVRRIHSNAHNLPIAGSRRTAPDGRRRCAVVVADRGPYVYAGVPARRSNPPHRRTAAPPAPGLPPASKGRCRAVHPHRHGSAACSRSSPRLVARIERGTRCTYRDRRDGHCVATGRRTGTPYCFDVPGRRASGGTDPASLCSRGPPGFGPRGGCAGPARGSTVGAAARGRTASIHRATPAAPARTATATATDAGASPASRIAARGTAEHRSASSPARAATPPSRPAIGGRSIGAVPRTFVIASDPGAGTGSGSGSGLDRASRHTRTPPSPHSPRHPSR
ncbi:hypothetical protein AIIKEEIJ_02166 [Rhodococcus sp. YH1]|nr:hypothetical protein [Rhodococcus sp. YH1]